MKFLIAPDKFKGSLSAAEAADAMARGVQQALAHQPVRIDLCPVADGGEGTVDALVAATGGELRHTRVTGPLGEPVNATWGLLGDGTTAVIEMAQAAGLILVPDPDRDPTATTTYGVGELILAALDAGATELIVGIGGSATNDGGTGMAQALGVRFEGGSTPMTGKALPRITAVDLSSLDRRLNPAADRHPNAGDQPSPVQIHVACDVTNPLTGPQGAAAIYGPQKGATPEQVAQLDAGLAHLASLLNAIDPDAPGMGAAGGLGFGLVAFTGARLQRGIDLVLQAVRFDQRVQNADWVLTGEGKLDGQSIHGKVCVGVAQAARTAGVPTVALVGAADDDADRTLHAGLHSYHAIVDQNVSAEQAIDQAGPLLQRLTERVTRQLTHR